MRGAPEAGDDSGGVGRRAPGRPVGSLRSSAPLKRWLSGQTDNRIFLLALAALLLGALLFSSLVQYVAEGGRRAGTVGIAATEIARAPRRLVDGLRLTSDPPNHFISHEQRFEGLSGWTVAADSSFSDPGWLLLNRYDGERERGVAELLDLGEGVVAHAWMHPRPVRPFTARTQVSWALRDGSLLLLVEEKKLAMLDACSEVRWRLDDVPFHHSVEQDADGHFWVPYDVPDPGLDFRAQGLARVSSAGEILTLIPLAEFLASGPHRHLLYSLPHTANPMHINDIQPVFEDGPAWRRGDLLVSLRSPSAVLSYRPSTNEIVWLKAGPWLHQQDVNIVGPREISVFSNNTIDRRGPRFEVLGSNEVWLYDPVADTARSPWRHALRQHDVREVFVGRARVLGDGDLFVEESQAGRALRMGADGSLRWTYVNRAPNGVVYKMGWSRYLEAEVGAGIAAAATTATRDCGSRPGG